MSHQDWRTKMDHKIRLRIKELFEVSGQAMKAGELMLERQKKPTPKHLVEALGTNRAAIALVADQVESLYQMHVGLERANLELEELIKSVIDQTDWKMQDPAWKEPPDEPGE